MFDRSLSRIHTRLRFKRQSAVDGFELNYPSATGAIILREAVQPALHGPYERGIQRAEYTVSVEGRNDRATFGALCPEDASGCSEKVRGASLESTRDRP